MKRTLVVGAGLIGLACAHALRKRGREVVVLELDRPGGACSKGNTGWVTPWLSAPLPAAGMRRKLFASLIAPASPVYVAPRAVPALARWLLRFASFCNPAAAARGTRALAALNSDTLAAYDRLVADGVRFEMHRDGLLFAYLHSASMRAHLDELRHVAPPRRLPEPMRGAELRRFEPAIAERVAAGFWLESERHVRPETLAAGYVDRLQALGVEIETGRTVLGPARQGSKWIGVETDRGAILGDEILVAAGAWSGRVLQGFGVSLPVQAGKGYSITVSENAPRLQRPIYLGEAFVGCSPFDGGLRFAGTMEFSGIDASIDRRRIAAIRSSIRRYLDGAIGAHDGVEWMGLRPLTPDGLPLLGRVPGFEILFVATGHAMLGVTLAPVTGERMAEVVLGEPSATRLAPFDPARFRW